jgi:hypothetical protein
LLAGALGGGAVSARAGAESINAERAVVRISFMPCLASDLGDLCFLPFGQFHNAANTQGAAEVQV